MSDVVALLTTISVFPSYHPVFCLVNCLQYWSAGGSTVVFASIQLSCGKDLVFPVSQILLLHALRCVHLQFVVEYMQSVVIFRRESMMRQGSHVPSKKKYSGGTKWLTLFLWLYSVDCVNHLGFNVWNIYSVSMA